MNLAVIVLSSSLSAHVGQDQFGRFPFVAADRSVSGGATSWGLVRADDVGGGWARVCEESFGPVVFFAVEQPGRILVGGIEGLQTTTDDGCSYDVLDNELVGSFVSAFWQDPAAPGHLLVGTSTVGAENGVWESRDGGDTWSELLPRRPGNFFNLAVSDDGARIAVSGNDGGGGVLLLMSDDAGASFVDVTSVTVGSPIVHALLFSGTDLVLGGINAASEGIVDRVAFDGTSAATTRVGTVPRETTHAAAFNDALYVLARNGARGELYVENDSALGFGVVAGGPSDCLFLHDGALYGCGKQVGAATSLFLRSDDGVTWTELVAFSDVHYRACPDDTVGFSECARFLETSCGDGDDSDLDGKTDCADEDCAFNAACAGDGEGDAGEGEGDVGEGEGDDVAGAREGDGGDETDRGGCSCAEVDAASLGAVLVPLAWRRRRRV